MNVQIRPLDAGEIEDVVRLSLLAWAPVFRSFQEVLGPQLYARLYPDWTVSQAANVERACTGWYDYRALTTLGREWRVWGDTALCNGDVRIDVIVRGTPKEFVSRYLQVWRRDASGWRMASWQSTPVPA